MICFIVILVLFNLSSCRRFTLSKRSSENSDQNSCNPPCHQNEQCLNGQCVVPCPPGKVPCNGWCTSLSNDIQNCGQCGYHCHASEQCINGQCSTPCPEGQVQCNGWCTSVSNDIQNCGNCGVICHQNEICSNGVCTPNECPQPYAPGFGYSLCGTQGITPNANQCATYANFLAGLHTSGYSIVTLSSSLNLGSYSCNITSIVNALAYAIKNKISYVSPPCYGYQWSSCPNCGNGYEVSVFTQYFNCDLCDAVASIRPCWCNYNWGGVNTATCFPPNQDITLKFV